MTMEAEHDINLFWYHNEYNIFMIPNIKVDVHDLNVTYHDEIEKKN